MDGNDVVLASLKRWREAKQMFSRAQRLLLHQEMRKWPPFPIALISPVCTWTFYFSCIITWLSLLALRPGNRVITSQTLFQKSNTLISQLDLIFISAVVFESGKVVCDNNFSPALFSNFGWQLKTDAGGIHDEGVRRKKHIFVRILTIYMLPFSSKKHPYRFIFD